jgi:peptide/nickel transport system substrate-binding protein
MIASAQGAVLIVLTVAADGSLVGELAESWEASSTQSLTFNLRQA